MIALNRYLKDHPEIHGIVVVVNNDTEEFGHTAAGAALRGRG